ncbi:MAG: hypothetical protein F7B17_01245 [Desulfurococcales archaeon]|nr:hypothetical protein [Desulfurococcales archaeon]
MSTYTVTPQAGNITLREKNDITIISTITVKSMMNEVDSRQENRVSIQSIYDTLKVLDEEHLLRLTKDYLSLEDESILALKNLREKGFIDLKKLVALLIWLVSASGHHYKVVGLDIAVDPETKEPLFINIYVSNCGWDQWKHLSKSVKKRLVKEGFTDVAGKVALVCKEALQALRG